MNPTTMQQSGNNSRTLRICRWIYETILNIKLIIAGGVKSACTSNPDSRGIYKEQPGTRNLGSDMAEIQEMDEESRKIHDIMKKDFSAKDNSYNTIPPFIRSSEKQHLSAKGKHSQKTIPPSPQDSGKHPRLREIEGIDEGSRKIRGILKHPRLPPGTPAPGSQDMIRSRQPRKTPITKDDAQEKKTKDTNLPSEKSTLQKEPENPKPKGRLTGSFSRIFSNIDDRSDEFINSRLAAMRRTYSVEGKKS